jgi:hypothetical protein
MFPTISTFGIATTVITACLFGRHGIRCLFRLHDLTLSMSWVADVVTMAMLTGQAVFQGAIAHNNSTVLFLLIVPFAIGVKFSLEAGSRIGTAIIWGGACGALLSVLVKTSAAGHWLYLVPVGYVTSMTLSIMSPSDTQESNTLFARLGVALVYTMLWAVSPQIASFIGVSDGIRLLSVLAIVTISTRAPISLALLFFVAGGKVLPPSILVSYWNCGSEITY